MPNRNLFVIACTTISILFTSCGTFKEKLQTDKNIALTKQTVSEIDNKFDDKPLITNTKSQFEKQKHYNSDTTNNYTFSNYILDEKQKNSHFDYFNVKQTDTKKISFYFFKNEHETDSVTYKFKLKKDGFIYLKDSNFKINGIPFLVGGFEINRKRLGLNQNGDLMLESVYYRYGALLIIIGDDRKFNTSSLFKKISH